MASFELREPKKKPRYYKLIANVLVNGKIERRYGRFDFDPTELKNARARNAAAKAAAAEFERLEQEYFYPLFLKKEIFHLPEALTLRTELE